MGHREMNAALFYIMGRKLLLQLLPLLHGKKILMQLNVSGTRLQHREVKFILLVTTMLLSFYPSSPQVNDVVMYL